MSDAKRKRSKGLLPRPLAVRIEHFAGRGGIVAYMADPVDPPAPAPSPAPAPEPAPPAPSPAPAPAPAPAPSPAPAPGPAPAPAPAPGPAPAPAPAPEYTDFTLPEGVKPDEAVMGEFKALAKELSLDQAGAQRLVDLNAKVEVARAAQWQSTVDGWEAAAKVDKEIGGDKFAENLALAAKARDQFGTPEFVQFLNQSKLGSHPEMLRAFFRIGQAISQDGFVPGRSGNASATPQAMYSASNMNP